MAVQVDHGAIKSGQILTIALLLAAWLLYSGQQTAGWGVVWLLIALTAISWLGWCAGCFTYYLLNRLGVKGYFGNAPTDGSVFLGSRPKLRADAAQDETR